MEDGVVFPRPTYIGEKGKNLGETHGIKMCCYWEHIGKRIRNLGNPLGTLWEPQKTSNATPPQLKRKKLGLPLSMLSVLMVACEFKKKKTICHHFSCGLMETIN